MSLRNHLQQKLHRIWYGADQPGLILRVLERVFTWASERRRQNFESGRKAIVSIACPVIVVGNITAGGSGKTPFVIWLADLLNQQTDWRPGIISRGYGSTAGQGPVRVKADSEPQAVGDEPLLIHHRTGLPVMVGADRVGVAKQLLEEADVNIIISDDGLQHYRLKRNLEIALIDHHRGIGNGRLLPAGPLREPESRLFSVDLNIRMGVGADASLEPIQFVSVADPECCMNLDAFSAREIHALAGISNPQRFFDALMDQGLTLSSQKEFSDHHQYVSTDLVELEQKTVIMTEKDAVKCRQFAPPSWWYLQVGLVLTEDCQKDIHQQLQALKR